MSHRECAVVFLSAFCRLLGLMVAAEIHGESQTQRLKPNQIATTLEEDQRRIKPLEELVFSPVYILTGSQADVIHGTGTDLGPEFTGRYKPLMVTVSVWGSLAGAQSMNFSVYLAVTAPDGVGEV